MRTLHRPMFRRGGSTGEGITSGLKRQGYDNGNTVQPRRPNTNLNNFLIDFGLDFLSRPPQGGLFATAGSSAKDPFKRFQERDVAQRDRDYQRQVYDDKMRFQREQFDEQKKQFSEELEQDRYLGELAAKGKDEFRKEMIDKVWDARIADAPPEKHAEMEKRRLDDIYRYVARGEDVSDQYKVLTNESAISMAEGLAEGAIVKMINPATNVEWTSADEGYEDLLLRLYKQYIKTTSEFLLDEEKATGGRVGRAVGGSMTEDVNVMTKTPGGIADINVSETVERDPGETNQIDISYEQLRDRLPAEISNEIVLLLSESYEAFSDFAEIQTQADVNEFNTKYNVQLFLPQQSGV
jgi:hypothetical protein